MRDRHRERGEHESNSRTSRTDRDRNDDRHHRSWGADSPKGRERNRDRERDRDKNERERRKPTDGSRRRDRDRSRSRSVHRNRDKERQSPRAREGGGEDGGRDKYRVRGREADRDRSPNEGIRAEGVRNRAPLPDQQVSFRGPKGPGKSKDGSKNPEEPPKEKEKANFKNTGVLAAASNTLNSVVLKYTEPVDSRLPHAHSRWRLFTFKDGEIVGSPLDLNSQPAWLIGRDRLVADIPVDHPSCSKQHAVIQFRNVVKKNEFGDKEEGVRPYVVDLESANGTFLNKTKLEDRRFVELRVGDMLVFGSSTRCILLLSSFAVWAFTMLTSVLGNIF